MSDVAAIILAAGQGTRMASDRAKVLHEISGKPMIHYVVETAQQVVDDIVVVVGHQREAVKSTLAVYPQVRFAVQKEQLGTGHAVMAALPELSSDTSDVVILCGDTPLIRVETLGSLIEGHRTVGRSVSLLVTSLDNPHGYGRVITDVEGRLMRIVEESDASDVERRVSTVNTGTYCVKVALLRRFLPALHSENVQGEFYLTDVIAQAYDEDLPAAMVSAETATEVLGVNTQEDLVTVEHLLRTVGRQVL